MRYKVRVMGTAAMAEGWRELTPEEGTCEVTTDGGDALARKLAEVHLRERFPDLKLTRVEIKSKSKKDKP